MVRVRPFPVIRALMLAAVLLQSCIAFAHYGFKEDPRKLGAAAVESTLVPENFEVLRLTQQDGTVRHFYRDRTDPARLLAEDPWIGYAEYGRAHIQTRDGFAGGITEFEFYNGTLRKMTLDREQVVVKPVKHLSSDTAIPALWKNTKGMLDEVTTLNIWDNDPNRFRIPFGGFVNPNKTAAVFTLLAVVFLSLLFVWLPRRRWVLAAGAAVLFLASVVFLFLTQSRGCLLGLMVGGGLLLAGHFREFKWFITGWRLPVLALMLLALGGVALKIGGARYSSGFLSQDARTDRRTVWAAVPKMIADSPKGWGFGNAGRAYVDWYQPADVPLAMAELQNSHLTWLVEMGNVGRVGYVFAWLLLMSVLAVRAFRDRRPLPLAVFAALGVSACFTHELEEPLLWVVPLLALVPLFYHRKPLGRRVLLSVVGLACIGSVGAAFGVVAWGAHGKGRLSILGSSQQVRLNGETPRMWIVGDDMVLDGGYQIYQGKEMRRFCESHTNAPAIGFTRELSSLPDKVGTLVLAGVRGVEYLEARKSHPVGLCRPEKLIFLSPPFTWKTIDEDLRKQVEVRVILGRLAGRLSSDYDLPPSWVTQVPGAELYIPNWLEMVTGVGK